MSYTVLARKCRPQVFEEVVGQAHITRTLQNAISSNRLAHAFLFSGPRGVGKTTTARILAKALNCINGPTPRPCGTCDSCRETTAGTSVDVIEIDGASNRGIEHIRELREAVKYAPSVGKYKVYVIDEVHMLTNEAFNALLKTLEEPPPHIIFIFATTEPQKIPATIHSRCQHYGFKRVVLNEIVERLRSIASTEGITVSEFGLSQIARAAEGSMRDSLSLLDQAVSYSGMEIKDTDLQLTLGTVSQSTLVHFADLLLTRDAAGLLKRVDELLEQGQDLRQFLSAVVEHVRNLMVVKMAAAPDLILEIPQADVETLRQQAKPADADHLLMLFDSLARTLEEMRWSPHQRFTFEVGLIKTSRIVPLKPLGEVLGKIQELEVRFSAARSHSVTEAHRVVEPPVEYRANKTGTTLTSSGQGKTHGDEWSRVLSALKVIKPRLATLLDHSTIEGQTEQELLVGVKSGFNAEQADKPENRSIIEQTVSEVFGRTLRIKIRLLEPAPAPEKEQKGRYQGKMKPEVQDPLAQNIANLFGGEVIEHQDDSAG